MCFAIEIDWNVPGNVQRAHSEPIIDAEFREVMLIQRPCPQDDLTIGDFTYTPSARRALVRHKLRLILMSRRYWFEHGSREAARRVTQELFDLAFAPGELDVLAKVK